MEAEGAYLVSTGFTAMATARSMTPRRGPPTPASRDGLSERSPRTPTLAGSSIAEQPKYGVLLEWMVDAPPNLFSAWYVALRAGSNLQLCSVAAAAAALHWHHPQGVRPCSRC